MSLRRALIIAACVLPAAAGGAAAQAQPPVFQPQQPLQQPLQQPPVQQQPPPCVQEFIKLRSAAEKKAAAIGAANKRKVPPAVACKLFRSFVAAEAKMLDYATEKGTWCGIPAQVIDNIKKAHANSTQIRNNVCRIAAAPPRPPPGPTLSEALGSTATSTDNIKRGHGTFDTLTGTPLGNQ